MSFFNSFKASDIGKSPIKTIKDKVPRTFGEAIQPTEEEPKKTKNRRKRKTILTDRENLLKPRGGK